MAIRILDQDLINKIAAGEVIERPASVVKELIENSLDAGATSIFIEIIEGGRSLIRVADNGGGMSARDLELSIERHATSKLISVADLFNIKTLGFRGEALASIAAVSNLKITSRTNEFLHGNFIEVEDGRIKLKKEVSATIGTVIEAADLFYNTPARKKYMENFQNEATKITDIITRFILINPKVYFRLIHNDKIILNSPPAYDKAGNILNVYGKDAVKQMVPVKYAENDIGVEGFISKPSLTRADKNQQSFYVNNRYISSGLISSAVQDAYGDLLFSHRYPMAVLSITIDPAKIDVNVHPAKKEIRFSQERQLYETIVEAVRTSLESTTHIPDVSIAGTQTKITETTDIRQIIAEKFRTDGSRQTVLEPVDPEILDDIMPNINILGLVHNCYILAEDEEGFCIIDQHAAEERVNYEIFQAQYEHGYIKSQQLVIPTHIEFSATDAAILRENIYIMKKFGFEIDDFGTNSFLVRATPVVMGQEQICKGAILDMIDELNANRINRFEEIKDKILARMACRKSIKQGDRIELGYMQKLLKRLYACQQPFTCPHGRPTIINITKSELEKKFKRTG